MVFYPEGDWYRSYLEKYEENVFKKFKEDIMSGQPMDYIYDYKKHYDDMLASGMFFEWNPDMCGIWETDKDKWIEKYGYGVEAEELNVQEPMPNYKADLEHIIKRLEHIIEALDRAVESGNDLHLGIVIGQTLIQLKDIARN
jgi:hypothetical protein